MADDIRQRIVFDVGDSLTQIDELGKRITSLSSRLGTLARKGSAFNTLGEGAAESLDHAARSADKFGSQIKQASDRANQSVQTLTVSFETLARVVVTQFVVRALSSLRTAINESIGDFIEFERSVSQITAIAPNIGFDALESSIVSLSDRFNLDLQDAAAGTFEAISNQIVETTDDLRILDDAAQFAIATNSSFAASQELLASAINAYGKEVQDAGQLTSVFFRSLDLGKLTADELNNAFGKAAPLASQLGVSIEEVNAALDTITIAGVNAQQAAVQVRGIFNDLIKPTDAMKEAFRQLGVESAEELIRLRGLSGTLQALIGTTDGTTQSIAKLFDEVRSISGVLRLAGSGTEFYTSTLSQLENVSNNLVKTKSQEVLARQGQQVSKAFNEIKNALTLGVGKEITATAAQLLQLTGGAEGLISAGRILIPQLVTAAAGLGAYAAAAAVARLRTVDLTLSTASLNSTLGATVALLTAIKGAESLGEVIGRIISDAQLAEVRGILATRNERIAVARETTELVVREFERRAKEEERILGEQIVEARRLHFENVENVREASERIKTIMSGAFNTILDLQQQRVRDLRNIGKEAERQLERSVDRTRELQQELQDDRFERGLERLTDTQKFFSLASVAQRTVRTTKRALAEVVDPEDIEVLIDGFSRAEEFARRALEVAEGLGDRPKIFAAEQQLLGVKKGQIAAEQQLQKLLTERQREAQRAAAVEENRLKRLKDLTAEILEKSLPFDKKGAALSDEQRQTRREELRNLLAELTREIKDADSLNLSDLFQVANLGRLIEEQLADVEIETVTFADKVFDDFASRLEQTEIEVSVRIANLEQFNRDVQEIANTRKEDLKFEERQIEIEKELALIRNQAAEAHATRFRNLFTGDDVDALRQISTQIVNLAQSGQLTRNVLQQLREQFVQAGGDENNFGLDFHVLQQLNAAERILKIQEQTQRERESLEKSITAEVDKQVFQGDRLLQQQRELNQLRREQLGIPGVLERARGGLIRYLAAGGFTGRGIDRIPAMLSPGEFVVNARSSRQFFSQLQAINAGVQPVFRGDGGSVSVGDINVTVQGSQTPRSTGRAIARELQREIRRGAIRRF